MAEHDHDPERQLDLLHGFGTNEAPVRRPEPLAVRWAEVDALGKLGRAAWPGSGIGAREDLEHLSGHHRASIVLAVADDPSDILAPARELGIDVRHLAPSAPRERLEQQASALAADLRAGRRAVVVGADASATALPVCAALVLLGHRADDAIRAVAGQAALAPKERAILDELASARAGGVQAAVSDRSSVEYEPSDAGDVDDARVASGVETIAAVREPAAGYASASELEDAAARVASETTGAVRERPAPSTPGDASASELEGAAARVARDTTGAVRERPAPSTPSDASASELEDAARVASRADTTDAVPADALDAAGDHEGEVVGDDDTIAGGRVEPGARIEAARDDRGSTETHDLDAIARSPRRSRLAGAVLGGAIGDAMGHPTEFIRSFDAIRERYGPEGVTGYELWREDGGRRFAPYTDDTQMAECVLRSLLWARERDADLDATMRDMAARFVSWANEPQGGHRAPGNACLAGCRNLERGVPWSEAGGASAGGCGSVMRAYPFGLVFANDLERAERWSVAHSKLTHRDPIALAASAALAIGVARAMRDDPLAVVLSEMVAAACRYSPKTAAMMARAIDEAQEGVDPETTLERLEGWAAHEAIAAAVYIVARHPDDPRAAILEGANTPGDSDSLATLAGALVGARAGIGAFPADWVRDVERVDELLALALAI